MAINIDSISYTYPENDEFAIRNISLNIEEGEIVGVIGHTGSGKSTFLQHLNALILPDEGSVVVDGIDSSSKKGSDIRKKVGLVFQYPEHQLFADTCYEDIAYGLRNIGLGDEEIKQRIFEAVDLLGINPEVLNKSPFEISGGQQRKVALAGVIGMKPKYLVLDEPTSGLDPQSRRDLFKTILQLRDKGMTVVLVSHSIDEIAEYTDRVVVFHKGEVIVDSPAADAFSKSDLLNNAGIELPKITEFYTKLADLAGLEKKVVLTEDEAYAEICKALDGE